MYALADAHRRHSLSLSLTGYLITVVCAQQGYVECLVIFSIGILWVEMLFHLTLGSCPAPVVAPPPVTRVMLLVLLRRVVCVVVVVVFDPLSHTRLCSVKALPLDDDT